MVCNCKCLLCQLSDRKKARKKSNNFATKWKGRDHLPSHYNPIVGVKLRGKNHVYANSHFIALKREYYLPTLSNLRMYISPPHRVSVPFCIFYYGNFKLMKRYIFYAFFQVRANSFFSRVEAAASKSTLFKCSKLSIVSWWTPVGRESIGRYV